jgi:cystathionine gamma-lyase
MTSHDALGCFADMLHHTKGRLGPGDLVAPPIVPASVYFLPGDPTGPYQYGRLSNPTWGALEDALGVLEQAETVVLPSGMAAIAAVLYSQLRPGDRVLLPSDGYYTTRSFAGACLAPMGVQADLCPTTDYEGRDLTGYRLVWIETPSNPGLDLCDVAAVAAKARAAGCLTVADNTTATPLGQRPLDQGDQRAFGQPHGTCLVAAAGTRCRRAGLAEADGGDSGTVRGVARASRPGNAGGSLRPYVR